MNKKVNNIKQLYEIKLIMYDADIRWYSPFTSTGCVRRRRLAKNFCGGLRHVIPFTANNKRIYAY